MLRAVLAFGFVWGSLAAIPPWAPAQIGLSLAQAQPESTLAQATPISGLAKPEIATRIIVLRPTVEPKRALQFSLLPDYVDRTPGNAAVGYLRVGLLLPKPATGQPGPDEQINKWLEMPLQEMPRDEVQKFLDQRRSAINLIESSARRTYCDWELPIREEPFFSILLPEVQEARSYARLLMLQARLYVAYGRFDEAIKTLQASYSLARHVAEGPTLINGLVGIAICAITSERLIELIEQPGAPSLYWPLTALPQPIIDLRRALETERNMIYLSYPHLRNLERRLLSVEEAQSMIDKLIHDFQSLGGNVQASGPMTTLVGLALYPSAKAALIADGIARERVEAMPVAQVLLIHAMRKFDESRDTVFRAMYLPYLDAQPYAKAAEASLQNDDTVFLPLARLLLPALSQVQVAAYRNQRQFAALRVVEALRLHAGRTGSLPDKLSDASYVPIPVDPFSGKPFAYQRTDDTAVLESEPVVGLAPHNGFRYELRLTQE